MMGTGDDDGSGGAESWERSEVGSTLTWINRVHSESQNEGLRKE